MTTIIDLLVFEEGFRARPYLDTEGYPTVGIGFLLAKTKCTPAELKKYYDFTLPEPVARTWLKTIIGGLETRLRDHPAICGAWAALGNDAQRAVLLSMSYQIGVEGLAKFPRTLRRMVNRDWEGAAYDMLKSKWAKQTPNRAKRHAEQMRTGKWCEEYLK